MKLLSLVLSAIVGAGAFAASNTSVSNLNYFNPDKKFTIETTFGWSDETADVSGSETSEDGINLNLQGMYGIVPNHTIGFNVGYVSTEGENNQETTGLNDIDLLWNYRFSQTNDTQWDLNFNLSPKLGAKEVDNGETNGLRGNTEIGVGVGYNTQFSNNLEFKTEAFVDFHTKTEVELAGLATADYKSNTDFGLGASTRYHTASNMFVGGGLALTFLGDEELDVAGATATEYDPTILLGLNGGYNINSNSNIEANLDYAMGSKENGATETDIDVLSISAAYNREF